MLFAVIFTLLSMTAFPQAGEKWSVGGNSISATGFFGTLNNFPINFKTNNVQRMTLTPAGFLGLGTAAPTVMFECTGNGKINNFKVNAILTVGNKISVSKIFSPAGIIDFEGSNLKTTAGISGASLTISGNGTFGNISANSFQNPLFAGAGSGLILSDANGSFQKLDFDGNQNTYLRGDGTFGFMPVNDAWKTVNGNIYTTGNFNVGIGIDSPIEKLDVNGNANIRGYLYVQDGVIIGKRIDGQRVNSDTIDVKQLAIKYATTDSLTSLKLATGKMAVSQDINIGEQAKIGSNIVIDGLTNNITTPGNITAGSITAGTMNVTNQSITNLNVSGGIKVGNSSIILGNYTGTGGIDNNIFAENSNLYLQSITGADNYNTILNANNTGNVGVGTNEPISKFQVGSAGSKICMGDGFTVGINPTTYWNASYLGFNAGRDYNNNQWLFDWDGAHNGGSAILSTINGDLRFVQVSSQTDAIDKQILTDAELLNKTKMIITGNGDVGIGTDNPQKRLHVKSKKAGSISAGQYLGSIRVENEVVNLGTTSTWDLEPIVENNDLGLYTRFSIGTPENTGMFTIIDNGNVGIGTSYPQSKLHVEGNVSFPYGVTFFRYNSGSDWDANPSRPFLKNYWAENLGDYLYLGSTGNTSNTNQPALVLSQTKGINFGKGSDNGEDLSTEWMRIDPSGKVGIGVTGTLTEKLEVNGTIKCTGINMDGSPFNNVWTKNGEDIFSNTTGNVGIGTTIQDAKFNIYAEFSSGEFNYGSKIEVKSNYTTAPTSLFNIYGQHITASDGTTEYSRVYGLWAEASQGKYATGVYGRGTTHGVFGQASIGIGVFGYSMSGDGGHFKSENGYGLIVEKGNVGFGTLYPSENLHIIGASPGIRFEDNAIQTGTEGLTDFIIRADNGVARLISDQSVAIFLNGDNNEENNFFDVMRNNTYYGTPAKNLFRIKENGYVGIGTENPLTNLHISGTGDQQIRIESTDHNSLLQLMAVSSNGYQESHIQFNNILRFVEPTHGTIRMSINSDGTVKVAGKILAEDVEVTATVAPDYVFAPDYKLSTLQEIEKYIKQNSHLPDVPSAKDFEKNGQNLGEMNFILLKKVEELTLHLIEQNKQIEQLKIDNKKLNEEMSTFKNK